MNFRHPQLGTLHRVPGEKRFEGEILEQYPISIDAVHRWHDDPSDGGSAADPDDGFECRPDPECEALALAELADVDGLLRRIDLFLATAREPYLDQWASREWELHGFVATKQEGRATFIVEYLLARDDYVVWQVGVEAGVPVAIGRR